MSEIKLDIFDAIKRVNDKIRDCGEIIITSRERATFIRLRAFVGGRFHNYEIMVTDECVTDSAINFMDELLDEGICALEKLIELNR